MKLREIQDQQLDYVHNSGVTVTTTPIYGYVSITDERGAEIFLQDSEGSEFISESRRLWESDGELTRTQCNELIAYKYVDLLAEIEPEVTT